MWQAFSAPHKSISRMLLTKQIDDGVAASREGGGTVETGRGWTGAKHCLCVALSDYCDSRRQPGRGSGLKTPPSID